MQIELPFFARSRLQCYGSHCFQHVFVSIARFGHRILHSTEATHAFGDKGYPCDFASLPGMSWRFWLELIDGPANLIFTLPNSSLTPRQQRQAHPGHLHEQVFSSPKQKDRGLCVIVLLCIGFIVVACTLALTAQLWILLKVDTQGLAHLQLRHGKMLSETPLQAKSVLLSGPVIPPAVSTTTGAGATTTFESSDRESVTLEVSTSLDSSPFSSVQTSAARGVVMSGPSVSVKVGGDAALLNVSARATTVTCSGRLAASTLQGSIAVNDIQNSQPATPLRLTSSSGAVAIAAGRSVLIESKPSGAHVARLSSGGRTTLTSTTAPLELNSGVVQINLSALTIRPVGFDTFATMKVCVCPRSAVVSKVGSLFMMPPNVSCTDWDDPTAYGTADSGSGSADPCL